MTRITIDDELRAKLHGLQEPVELCNEAGDVVADVIPRVDLAGFEAWEPPYDPEELRRIEQSDAPRYTTEEVIRHLESL